MFSADQTALLFSDEGRTTFIHCGHAHILSVALTLR